jgi:hypothetical protein
MFYKWVDRNKKLFLSKSLLMKSDSTDGYTPHPALDTSKSKFPHAEWHEGICLRGEGLNGRNSSHKNRDAEVSRMKPAIRAGFME